METGCARRWQVDRWGEIQVVLIVRKRTTTIGTKRPSPEDHRSAATRLAEPGRHAHLGLNREVLPLLSQQVLESSSRRTIDYISEATDTSIGFEKSLQVAC